MYCGDMARPTGTGGRAKELSKLEIQRVDQMLIGTTHEHRNRCLLYLCLGGGFRISEAVGLKVRDVSNGSIRPQVVLKKHSTKSKRSRTVFLSRQAQQQLKAYLATMTDAAPDAPLFPTQKKPRESMSPNVAVQTLKKMFLRAGIDDASSHSLRRTHANSLRRNGVDLKIIKEQLGHSSLQVTDRYFEVDPVEASKAVEGLRF